MVLVAQLDVDCRSHNSKFQIFSCGEPICSYVRLGVIGIGSDLILAFSLSLAIGTHFSVHSTRLAFTQNSAYARKETTNLDRVVEARHSFSMLVPIAVFPTS